MISATNGRHWLMAILVIGLGLSGCSRTTVGLGDDRVDIRLPDRYLIKAEVADTVAEREQGLSGRESLMTDAGMWFVFEQDGIHPFYMPEMNFPIDIIWVGSDLRVVEIDRNVLPEPGVLRPRLKRYINQKLARYVLEVPSGTALDHKVEVGSRIELISS